MRRRRVPAHGLSLAISEWGELGAPLVLMLHGFQDVGASFDDVAEVLATRGHHVVAPDLRGFGDSDRVAPGGWYYFPDYVFDVVELVDSLSPDASVALVGHSMGGTIAGLVAGTIPARIRKLALIEGVGPPSMSDDHAVDRMIHFIEGVRRARTRNEKLMSREDALARLAISHPTVEKHVLARRAEQLTRPSSIGGDGLVWAFDPLHRARSPFEFKVERWRSFARRITADTLCIGGGPTGFHPDDEAERIASIPAARSCDIDGAGHMVHWTRASALAEVLASFLSAEPLSAYGP